MKFLQAPWTVPPVLKQCFVTTGVSLNTSAIGTVLGFTMLLEQLKLPGSSILIDDEEGSWIASIPGIFAFPGAILIILIMEKYGRKTGNLLSIIIIIVSWVSIVFASNTTVLFIARMLQGINIGMTLTLGPPLIGEYTSPKNRGVFLMMMSVTIGLMVISVHVLASLTTWRICALAYAIIALIDLIIVLLSPESPSWLASQGKYDQCKIAFRWLRGQKEEEELDKMIKACIFLRNMKKEAVANESALMKAQKKIRYFEATVRKPEFYKPLIIACHLYTVVEWTGINVLLGYPEEYLYTLSVGEEYVPFIIISIDTHRFVACIVGMYIIKKMKRRSMLLAAVSMNVIALIVIGVYGYIKEHYTLSFDHPIIGVILTHILTFFISAGTLPLSYAIVGEIFPLKGRTIAGGIGTFIFSSQLFVSFKTIPYCLTKIGLLGSFCIYAVILSYCMLVVWFLLPETKDKTLQDIEEDFRGKPLSQELDNDP